MIGNISGIFNTHHGAHSNPYKTRIQNSRARNKSWPVAPRKNSFSADVNAAAAGEDNVPLTVKAISCKYFSCKSSEGPDGLASHAMTNKVPHNTTVMKSYINHTMMRRWPRMSPFSVVSFVMVLRLTRRPLSLEQGTSAAAMYTKEAWFMCHS